MFCTKQQLRKCAVVMTSILHDIDIDRCSLRKLKKLRKIIKKKPEIFFNFPKSDYAKCERKFLEKLINGKRKEIKR